MQPNPDSSSTEKGSSLASPEDHPFLRPINRTPLPGFLGAMLAVWHLRPATQRRFPLQTNSLRQWLRYLAWCATDGRREYDILRESPAWDALLSLPVDLPPVCGDRWEGTHSLMTFLHGVAAHRWSLSGMLGRAASREQSSRHYWRGARHRNRSPAAPAWQQRSLLAIFGTASNMARNIAMRKHGDLPDDELCRIYGLADLGQPSRDASGRPEPFHLPATGRLVRSPLPLPRIFARCLEPLLQQFRRAPSHDESVRISRLIAPIPNEPRIDRGAFGVNLIGFARGELGIGEDIRQMALALEAQQVPVCILDFAPGKNISQADSTAERFMTDEPRYGINVFCLTGIETTRYVCERGLSTVEGRYNIGLWPWELPDWPENCRHAYACVDEIWGISEFTAKAHRFAAPRPVRSMGLPVGLGPVGPQTRSDFGLPERAYLFAFAFDVSSSPARKNPEGLIHAFQKAFPDEPGSEVGLVLKVSHTETKSKLWKKIRSQARRDLRIHLIERTMRRPEILALINACDCYVSLHRGEGFGRCLAEALLLDKQLIATGFSGNIDFCREPRVALVRHTMRRVRPGEYMWSEGQSWAEPDIDRAAELMRSVRSNPRDTSHRDFDFSPATVGARYAARLREIWSHHSPHPLPTGHAC